MVDISAGEIIPLYGNHAEWFRNSTSKRAYCSIVAVLLTIISTSTCYSKEPLPDHIGPATEYLRKGDWAIMYHGPEDRQDMYRNYPDDDPPDNSVSQPEFFDPRIPEWNMKIYRRIMKKRERVMPMHEEMEALHRFENRLKEKGKLPENPLTDRLSEDVLYRSMTDGERQSIREFFLYEDGSIRYLKLYFVIQDSHYQFVTAKGDQYYLTGFKGIMRQTLDRDRDGVTDKQELCASPYGLMGVGTTFGSDCQLTDVDDPDTDDDGWWDGLENVLSSDPRDAGHVPDLTKINEWFDGKEEEPKILFAEDP